MFSIRTTTFGNFIGGGRVKTSVFLTAIAFAALGFYFLSTLFAQAANTYSIDLERDSLEYLTAADSTSLSITGDMTIEAWIKFETIPPYDSAEMQIASKYDSGASKRTFIFSQRRTSGSQYLTFAASASGGSGATVKDVAWTPSASTWYHVAVVYDASAGSAAFYVNGAQQGSTQTGLPNSLSDTDTAFTVGGSAAEGGYFDGLIDEIRVWNFKRTAQEISDDKYRELYGNEDGLAAYWKFNSNNNDTSANGNNLTGVNTPTDTADSSFPSFSELLKVRKGSNESVSNASSGTILQSDDALKLNLLDAKTYIVDGVILASSTSATPDIKLAFFGPTGSTITLGYTGDANETLLQSGAVSSRISLPANTPVSIHIKGTIVTSGDSGDLQLKWAQVTGDSASVTVLKGSYLRAESI